MTFIRWTSALELPNDEVNEQHRELVARLNAFHAALTDGESGGEDPAAILAFLVQYVGQHFAREEELMAGTDYPHSEDHKAEHRRLREQVQERSQAFIDGKAIDGNDLLELLKRWLVQHILGWDAEMATHLR